jgi:hypothetical protein
MATNRLSGRGTSPEADGAGAAVIDVEPEEPDDVKAEEAAEPRSPVRAIPVAAGVKRKRGRPPKPKNAAEVPHLPKPKQYRMKPGDFLAYWKRIYRDFGDRLTVYAYRLWPVTDRTMIGAGHNIEKMVEPWDPKNWEQEMLHRWGSGDYKLYLKDSGLGKTVAITVVKGLRDPEYPPVVRLEELVMEDPANYSYIEQLKLKGVIPRKPEEVEEENDMAQNSQAVEALTGTVESLTDKVVQLASKQETRQASKDDADAAAAAVHVVKDAAEMGNKIIEQSIARAGNPIEMLTSVLNVVKELKPAQQMGADPVLTQMVTTLTDRLTAAEQRAWEAQNKRIEFAEKVAVEAAAASSKAQPAAPPPQQPAAEKPKSLVEQLRELKDLREELGGMVGENRGGGGGWSGLVERIPDLVKSVALGLAGLASVTHNLAVLKAGKGSAAPPPPPEMAQEVSSEAVAGELPSGGISMEQQQQNEIQYLIGLMNKIRRPLLKYIADGRGGDEFAELVIDMEAEVGPIVHQRLKELGKDQILLLLQTDKELWAHLSAIPSRVSQFLDEFLQFDYNQPEPAYGERPEPHPEPEPRRKKKVQAIAQTHGPDGTVPPAA